ncbi:MAG: VOC family protein [Clostridia bacterium]|nr:VOC family protein [Clostridia bacterium]
MKIEHVALYVNDLEVAKVFFETYFGGVPGAEYHNKTTGFRSYFLSFSDGARLEIMQKPGVEQREAEPEHTGFAHIAFSLGSKEAVDMLTERLKNDGYRVLGGPRTTGDGYYESCIAGPEGHRIEITE